jgi:hypothetical protein
MSVPTSHSDIALPTTGSMYRHWINISWPWFATEVAAACWSVGWVRGATAGLTITRRCSALALSSAGV